jgi:chromosome partitioning protein
VLRSSQVPGLDLITSSADLNLIENSLTSERRPHEVVSRALESVKEMYHVIVIDCAASLGLLARAALVASDSFLVPTEPGHLSNEGLRNTIETARRCCHQSGSRSNLLGILINRCRNNAAPHRRAIEALREEFGDEVLDTLLPQAIETAEAPAAGQPVTALYPASDAADAYRRLALELCERLGIDAPERDQVRPQEEITGSGWVSPFPESAN